MKFLTTTVVLLLLVFQTLAQHTETISKEIAFESSNQNNVFYLANINGNVNVTAYQGDKIVLKAIKKIDAKSEGRLNEAIENLNLGIVDRLDTIIVYIKGPCERFAKGDTKFSKSKSGWSYNWDNCNYKFDYSFDFELQIPSNMRVYLSTVNKGDVTIDGLKGAISAHNVNGAISIKNASGPITAHTVNGDVTITYSTLPKNDLSNFYTLNGDINAYYPKGLAADMSFKSFNGDFYTNIDEVEYKSVGLEKIQKNTTRGIAFKAEMKSLISVRGGGSKMDFETFNGDVFVREQ